MSYNKEGRYSRDSLKQDRVLVYSAPHDKDHIYGLLNLEAVGKAAKELSATGFREYILLALNNNGFSFDLGPKYLQNKYGKGAISEDSYASGRSNLIKNGYLVSIDSIGNHKVFLEDKDYCDPQKIQEMFSKQKQQWIKTRTPVYGTQTFYEEDGFDVSIETTLGDRVEENTAPQEKTDTATKQSENETVDDSIEARALKMAKSLGNFDGLDEEGKKSALDYCRTCIEKEMG